MGTVPRMKTYRIAGLFEVGMYEYDNGFIYMPLDAAQTFFRLPEAVNATEVFVGNPDNADDARIRLQTVRGPGYSTVDWQRSNAALLNDIPTQHKVILLLLYLHIMLDRS